MVYDPNNKPENPYAKIYANFLKQTEDHTLTVQLDDGLNRQMRVGAPDSGIWSWRVVTWPGYLATFGDIADGYLFTRIQDMMHFFDRDGHHGYYSDGAPSIDFRYWAEKLSGGRSREVKKYDSDYFLRQVREHLEESETLGTEAQGEYDRQLALLRRIYELDGSGEAALQKNLTAYLQAKDRVDGRPYAVGLTAQTELALAKDRLWSTENFTDAQHDLLDNHPDWHELGDTEIAAQSPADRRAEVLEDARLYAESEQEAHEWLRDNEDHVGSDTWEWDMRDYDMHFIFACYAIDKTVQLWREYEKTPEAIEHRKPRITLGSDVTAEHLRAVLEFAERGVSRELGAFDHRNNYTDDDLATLRERFENGRQGINGLTAALAQKE